MKNKPFIKVKSSSIENDYCEVSFNPKLFLRIKYILLFQGYQHILSQLSNKKWKNDKLEWSVYDGMNTQEWNSFGLDMPNYSIAK